MISISLQLISANNQHWSSSREVLLDLTRLEFGSFLFNENVMCERGLAFKPRMDANTREQRQ